MSSVESVFYKDVAEKKRTARGVYSKKTHNGKAGCRLPSESLTAKEKAALNGPVVSYNLSKPMTWGQYRALPNDQTRALYLTKLVRDIGAKDCMLSKMFGVSDKTVFNERTRLGIATTRSRATNAARLAWETFIGQSEKVQESPAEATENVQNTAEIAPENVQSTPDVRWEDLFAAAKLLGERYGVTVRIEVTA